MINSIVYDIKALINILMIVAKEKLLKIVIEYFSVKKTL